MSTKRVHKYTARSCARVPTVESLEAECVMEFKDVRKLEENDKAVGRCGKRYMLVTFFAVTVSGRYTSHARSPMDSGSQQERGRHTVSWMEAVAVDVSLKRTPSFWAACGYSIIARFFVEPEKGEHGTVFVG